jgi:hypothetical protein
MSQRVRSCQMFEVCLTVSSRPQMTLKLMRDQPHTNQETIRQILHREMGERFDLQPDGRAKVPQKHDW